MSKNLSYSAVLIILFFAIVKDASATATTHIWAPSTDVQAYGIWHVTADVYVYEGKTDTVRNPSVTNLGLTVGVLPFKNYNLEVGIDHKSGTGIADDYPIYFNAKFGIPENAHGNWFPAVAVGIFDAGTKSDVTDYNVLYGKLAKTLGPIGRLSTGYFSGNDKLLLNVNGEKDNSGFFGAWERTMTEMSDKLWICAEYMGAESSYGTVNFGAAWKFAPNVSMIVGYDIYNNSDIPPTVTVQVDVDFGLWK